MHRIEGLYNDSNLFVDGPPGTVLTDNWLNTVQEEIAYMIEQAGLTLKTAGTETSDQFYTAIDTIIDAAVAAAPTGGTEITNLIHNGAMNIAQRNTSFVGISTSTYTLDRWEFAHSGTGVVTVNQSTTVPSGEGFANSLHIDVTTADVALATTVVYDIRTRIEAQDLQHLLYGQSGALSLTLSFWVRSNLTGQFSFYIYVPDGGRVYCSGYTINVADTWEQKTIVIPGDTAGTINNDTGEGFLCVFPLGFGSNFTNGTKDGGWAAYGVTPNITAVDSTWNKNVMDNVANELFLTGVQLEVGDTANDFEHRSFERELEICQRYFCKSYDYDVVPGTAANYLGEVYESETRNNTATVGTRFPVPMRSTPTITVYAPASGNSGNVSNNGDKAGSPSDANQESFARCGITGGLTAFPVGYHYTADADL